MTIKGSLQESIATVWTFFEPIFGPKFGWVNAVKPSPYMICYIEIAARRVVLP